MENDAVDNSKIHEGHRQRMKAKLLAHGSRIFDTYELLEMLLYYSVPYKDTNPIAKRLLSAFGSLDGVMRAKRSELVAVPGVGPKTAELISRVGELSWIIGSEPAPSRDAIFSEYSRVGEYLVKFFGESNTPEVAVMLLDNGMKLLATERLYKQDYSMAGVRSMPFITAALRHGASVAVTAHTHPHGPLYPSEGDKATNDMITSALESAGIIHVEHFIVSGNSYIGFMGVLPRRIDRYTDELSRFIDGQCRAIDKVSSVTQYDYSDENILDTAIYPEDYHGFLSGYFLSLSEFALGKRSIKGAEEILKRYLSIESTISADAQILVDGVGESAAVFYKLMAYLTSRRVADGFAFGKYHDYEEYRRYFKALFLGTCVEMVYAMLIDGNGRAIDCRLVGEGTVNASDVVPRRILEVATRARASSVILVHNHPFGNTEPSREDVRFTTKMMGTLSSAGIRLAAHYIVAGQRCEPIASATII